MNSREMMGHLGMMAGLALAGSMIPEREGRRTVSPSQKPRNTKKKRKLKAAKASRKRNRK